MVNVMMVVVPCCSLKGCKSKDAQAARRCNAAGRKGQARQAGMDVASSYRAIAVAVRRHGGSHSSGGMGMGTWWGMGCVVGVWGPMVS